MIIKKMKVKDGPNFCFACGRTIEKEQYVLNLGNPASTFEFCKSCLKKIAQRTEAVLAEK